MNDKYLPTTVIIYEKKKKHRQTIWQKNRMSEIRKHAPHKETSKQI